MIKYVCIKNFTYVNSFHKGDLYFLEIQAIQVDFTYFTIYNSDRKFLINKWMNNLEEYFITLAEHREQQLNLILNE